MCLLLQFSISTIRNMVSSFFGHEMYFRIKCNLSSIINLEYCQISYWTCRCTLVTWLYISNTKDNSSKYDWDCSFFAPCRKTNIHTECWELQTGVKSSSYTCLQHQLFGHAFHVTKTNINTSINCYISIPSALIADNIWVTLLKGNLITHFFHVHVRLQSFG